MELRLPFAFGWQAGRPLLRFHHRWFEALNQHPDWLADWLEEELIHLLLGHQYQRSNFKDKQVFDLAADVVVGQYLSNLDRHHERQELQQRLHLQEPFSLQQAYERIENLHVANRNNNNLSGVQRSTLSRLSHHLWLHSFQALSFELHQLWCLSLRNFLPQSSDITGSRFALLYNQLPGVNSTPTIPWPVLLRRFALSGKRDQSYSSLSRPSKRYHNFPGTRRQRRARLVVIIDTSGSVGKDIRLRFFQELQQLAPRVHQIQLVEADNQIQQTYLFTGQIPALSYGGGATNFDPALAWINQQTHLDGVIYLTDGEGPAPKTRCRFPLLWLITSDAVSAKMQAELPGVVLAIGS